MPVFITTEIHYRDIITLSFPSIPLLTWSQSCSAQ